MNFNLESIIVHRNACPQRSQSATGIWDYFNHLNTKLAECVALGGEPEQAAHGMKERRAAASRGTKGKRVTIQLVAAFVLTTYVTWVGKDVDVACIHTDLISDASTVLSLVPLIRHCP